MVTHRDYSIAVDPVWSLINGLLELRQIVNINNQGLKIKAFIREGGMKRKLVQDNNRIFEMYKLDDPRPFRAMSGLDSTVSEWQAANLEASAYAELMRVPYKSVTMELVEEAYGYNAMSVLLGNTPQKMSLESGSPVATYHRSGKLHGGRSDRYDRRKHQQYFQENSFRRSPPYP
jgi:hypothetical protein